MKSIIIAGAGQFGHAICRLLNRNFVNILGYADNRAADMQRKPEAYGESPISNRNEGGEFEPPVYSFEAAVKLNPDTFIIGVGDEERSREMETQIRKLGFEGTVFRIRDFYGMIDARMAVIREIALGIRELGIAGHIAELGVYKGDTAWQMNELFPEKNLYLFDTFSGFYSTDIEAEREHNYSRPGHVEFGDTSVDFVCSRLPYPERAVFCKGYFPESAENLDGLRFSMVSLDADLYKPTLAGLEYFVPRLNKGGAIILHDYNNPAFAGVKAAVKDFEAAYGRLDKVPVCDLHGSCVIL